MGENEQEKEKEKEEETNAEKENEKGTSDISQVENEPLFMNKSKTVQNEDSLAFLNRERANSSTVTWPDNYPNNTPPSFSFQTFSWNQRRKSFKNSFASKVPLNLATLSSEEILSKLRREEEKREEYEEKILDLRRIAGAKLLKKSILPEEKESKGRNKD